MEVALAAGSAAVFSACAAALKDHPEIMTSIRKSLRHVRAPFAPPSAEDMLQDSLRGLPVALDTSRSSLDGSRRGLRTSDLLRVAACLQTVPPGTLRKLNLSHTPLSIDAALALSAAHTALSALSVLRLRGCALGDAGATLICEALHDKDAASSSQLCELALSSNELTPQSAVMIADAVRELPSLSSLDLSYNQLGAVGCCTIADAVGERGALHSLCLASVGLGDDAIVRIAGSLSVAPLTEIDLDGNSAGDAAMGALLGMAARTGSLGALMLRANAVGEAGARALASHLRSRPSGPLRSVALSNNPIGVAGGEALRMAVRANLTLIEASLTGSGLTSDQASEIDECVSRNRSAMRQQSRQHTKSLLRAASVQIAENTDRALGEAAAAATAAKVRTPSDSLLVADSHAACSPAESDGRLDPAAAAGRCAGATDVALSRKARSAPHDGLVDGVAFQSPQLSVVGGSLPDSPIGDLRSSAAGLALGAADDGGVRFEPTADLSAGIVRARRELCLLPSARHVVLHNTGLADEHAEEIAEYLRDNSGTELVHLGGNELTDEGVVAIAAALGTCAVRRLCLAGNIVQDEGARALAQALAAGFAPQQLDLSDNMITDSGAVSLVQAAAQHTGGGLVWLDLSDNPSMTDDGRREAATEANGATFELRL